jgi:NifU-like protein involved in Fe-S cluster formation
MTYSEKFKSHVSAPRFAGSLEMADCFAEESNPVCGDRLQLYLRIDKDRVSDARFMAYGCAATIACGSALTELIVGEALTNVKTLTRREVIEAVGGLPSRKQHAAALAVETLRSALVKLG